MKKILPLTFLLICLTACKKEIKNLDSKAIIAQTIARAGGSTIDTSTITFTFRDKFYKASRNYGNFSLERCSDEACKDTLDQLTNSDFKRFVKGKTINLEDSLISNLAGGVNSVHYFSVLPYGLNAEAVKSKKIGEATIKGKTYYKIEVRFAEEGGGEDFEDNYMYWIDTEDFTVDYLAYNYHVNEGGTRFREAYNIREVNGVRFVDYNNYEPLEQFPPLQSLDSLFENGKLRLLSKIELENIEVTACSSC
ncbi:DUF6503 family protein [Leeuwenhoekiella sp. MAR_2009_132]|uniref:DUF6503 family protein n=1 Tax=Leeuwenhoekiella sp. MAR_2009_132 TaxID=1392489 RepID=UPI00048DEA0A|nr:DUF6503 family protein [Leeuwenhoekiella sp. MAR_2009_132]